jgi:hypothetical protein
MRRHFVGADRVHDVWIELRVAFESGHHAGTGYNLAQQLINGSRSEAVQVEREVLEANRLPRTEARLIIQS